MEVKLYGKVYIYAYVHHDLSFIKINIYLPGVFFVPPHIFYRLHVIFVVFEFGRV